MNLLVARDKEQTKLPKVMRAALKLFVQKGIDSTTIKDIARAAGVAEGALYRHYRSKDELAWDLFKTNLGQFTAALMTVVLPEKTAHDRVRRFVEESFKAFDEDPDLFSYLILREHSELDQYSADQSLHPGNLVLRIIEEGQKSGEIRPGEPALLGSLFVGAVIRVCVVKMYGNFAGPLAPRSLETAELIWRMLEKEGERHA